MCKRFLARSYKLELRGSAFPGEKNTYWKQHKTTAGIEEYDFTTIREVREKLHKQWKKEEEIPVYVF